MFITTVIIVPENGKRMMNMASDREYLEFVLEQLSETGDVAFRAMMGEYVIYYKGKVIGGIYDNRFLVKVTPSSRALMPEASLEIPYPGGKEMLLVEDIENKVFLKNLFASMLKELPETKRE